MNAKLILILNVCQYNEQNEKLFLQEYTYKYGMQIF